MGGIEARVRRIGAARGREAEDDGHAPSSQDEGSTTSRRSTASRRERQILGGGADGSMDEVEGVVRYDSVGMQVRIEGEKGDFFFQL